MNNNMQLITEIDSLRKQLVTLDNELKQANTKNRIAASGGAKERKAVVDCWNRKNYPELTRRGVSTGEANYI